MSTCENVWYNISEMIHKKVVSEIFMYKYLILTVE